MTNGNARSCFVLMPFGPEHRRYYDKIYGPTILESGLEPVRADETFSTLGVMSKVSEAISLATILIADLSDARPNVFYELGLAHAIGKPVILVRSASAGLPFDVNSLDVLDRDAIDFRERLLKAIFTALAVAKRQRPWFLSNGAFARAALGICGICRPVQEAYVEIRNWVKNAKERLLIINNCQHDWHESDELIEVRSAYFADLVDAATKRYVPYKRLIQLRHDQKLSPALDMRPLLRSHVADLIRLRRATRHSQISIKHCMIKSILDFVLVDNCIALQIPYYDHEKRCFVQGDYLLLEDQLGELTNSLALLFQALDNDSFPATDADLSQTAD